jgi:hypothetical protein
MCFTYLKSVLYKNKRVNLQTKLFFYYFFKNKTFLSTQLILLCYFTGYSRAVLKTHGINRLTFIDQSKNSELCFVTNNIR